MLRTRGWHAGQTLLIGYRITIDVTGSRASERDRGSSNPILIRPGFATGLEFSVLILAISGAAKPVGNGLQPYSDLPVHRGGSGFCYSFFRQGKLTSSLRYGQIRPLYRRNMQRICTDGP